MKKTSCIIFFLLVATFSFSQQFLWTTKKDDSSQVKYVTLKDVADEVLEFYDHYEYYYDGAGYSKDGFVKYFEKSQSFKNSGNQGWDAFKKQMYQTTEITVFAFRTNTGKGSAVLVLCISKENVNLVTFTNIIEENFNITHRSDREKFKKWFNTLLE